MKNLNKRLFGKASKARDPGCGHPHPANSYGDHGNRDDGAKKNGDRAAAA